MLHVGTDNGLVEIGDDGRRQALLEAQPVEAIDGGWAIVDRFSVVALGSGLAAVLDERPRCLTPTDDGVLVGTAGAHVFSVDDTGAVTRVESFDAIPTRDEWYTPWDGPPDTRSLTIADGQVLVNVHVGGVWRGGESDKWDEVVEVEADTHQVLAGPPGSGLVVVAAAVGFGWSHDSGRTWSWTTAGLHATYCRAVAIADGWVLLSASTGPFTKDGRLYRRPLDAAADEPFVRCSGGLPSALPFNIDTRQLAASGATVALGTDDGRVFRSEDAGESWSVVAEGLAPVRSVAVSA